MTTPTPNERDWKVSKSIREDYNFLPDPIASGAMRIASYRQQIEAEKDKDIQLCLKSIAARDKRISTLEAALEKAEKAVKQGLDALCRLGSINDETRTGWAIQALDEAEAAIADALLPTSPQPTSASSTDLAAAK